MRLKGSSQIYTQIMSQIAERGERTGLPTTVAGRDKSRSVPIGSVGVGTLAHGTFINPNDLR